MKKIMTLVSAVACAAMLCTAQERRPSAEKPSSPAVVPQNYTIHLQGDYAGMAPITLTLTGSGPEFSVELADPMVTFQARLTPGHENVSIQYEITLSFVVTNVVSVKSTSSQKPPGQLVNVQTRRSKLTGTAVLEDGQPLAIATLGQQRLELTVTRCIPVAVEKK